MSDKKNVHEKTEQTRIDSKEFQLPETTFVHDVDNRVFQGIILQTLSKIQGIGLLEGNFIDHMLGREEGVKGLHAEQDLKNRSLKVKIEVNIAYGVSIPQKGEEIQSQVAEDLTKFTGLHVSEVHVVFRSLIPLSALPRKNQVIENPPAAGLAEEYTDIF